jgi:hypothetical protein
LVGSGFGQSAAAGGRSAGAWRTVRVLPADGPLFEVVSGGSVCFHGSGPDGPRCGCGQSAAVGRTVRVACADSPPLLTGRSARAWVLCFLVRFLPPSFVLPRVLQGIVPKTWGWSITSLSWRLVCDSLHHSCVTGICLGYRLGSLRRIFIDCYSLPPSLVAIRSFIS